SRAAAHAHRRLGFGRVAHVGEEAARARIYAHPRWAQTAHARSRTGRPRNGRHRPHDEAGERMKRILRYLRAKRFASDLAEEMQEHLDRRIDDLIANGFSPAEARERALRQFGNRTRLAELSREHWAFLSLEEIAQDLRYAARMLRRNPAFALVAVLSLGLG